MPYSEGMDKEIYIPQTLVEAIQYFGDPDNTHDFMVSLRWPEKITCPHCESDKIGKLIAGRRIWNCKGCKKQFSAKVGTIFEDSPLPLGTWLTGVWLIVNAKNGISSYEIHRSLGITQKTAWFMLHRIRLAMREGTFKKMRGICEADETYIGAKARYMHKNRRTGVGDAGIAKTPIQGILQRGKGKRPSRVVLKVVATTRRPELCGNVRQHVAAGSTICTDALMSYDDLSHDYDRQIIDHLECYAKGHVHTNGLENFWSLLKRSLKGTYVSVEPFHLYRYCDEQAYRFNERKGTDSERFARALSTVSNRRLTYKELTGKTS